MTRPQAVVYAIYRKTNTSFLRPLVKQCQDEGWTVVLWALDEVSPDFEAETLGSGGGTKFGLIRKMAASRPPLEGESAIVLDDDVILDRGSLSEMLTLAGAAEVDLVQPSHSFGSYWSHKITIARPFSRLRLTNFVEIGPVFAILPQAHWVLAELPEDMGWGYELVWWQQWREGRLRMAVVDAVRITHVVPAAGIYGMEDLMIDDLARLRALGFRSWGHLQKTVGTWFTWRSSPRTVRASKAGL